MICSSLTVDAYQKARGQARDFTLEEEAGNGFMSGGGNAPSSGGMQDSSDGDLTTNASEPGRVLQIDGLPGVRTERDNSDCVRVFLCHSRALLCCVSAQRVNATYLKGLFSIYGAIRKIKASGTRRGCEAASLKAESWAHDDLLCVLCFCCR